MRARARDEKVMTNQNKCEYQALETLEEREIDLETDIYNLYKRDWSCARKQTKKAKLKS
jgi:hypothetical protein